MKVRSLALVLVSLLGVEGGNRRSTPLATFGRIESQVYTYGSSYLLAYRSVVQMLVRGLHLLSLCLNYRYTPITHACDSFISV